METGREGRSVAQAKRLSEVGELFRQKRGEKNLSLKEVENATSIRIKYIQAIESGTIGHHISPVYAQGFVRRYAQYLGLDGERLVEENADFLQSSKELGSGEQVFEYGIGTLGRREIHTGGVRRLPNFAWAAMTVGGLVAAWYLAKAFGWL